MSQNQFVLNFGTPHVWDCPDCGVRFMVYPGLPFDRENHNCAKKRSNFIPTCICWWVMLDDHRVESFVVEGLPYPDEMSIETLAPDGTKQYWERRQENGRDVFYPPKCYRDAEFHSALLAPERGALMQPGPRQKLCLKPRPQLERAALGNRHSVDLWLKSAAARGPQKV